MNKQKQFAALNIDMNRLKKKDIRFTFLLHQTDKDLNPISSVGWSNKLTYLLLCWYVTRIQCSVVIISKNKFCVGFSTSYGMKEEVCVLTFHGVFTDIHP